jgi:hypothetical protein
MAYKDYYRTKSLDYADYNLDIYMSGVLMKALLGGGVGTKEWGLSTVPVEIRALISGCLMDMWANPLAVHDEMTKIAKKLYGEPKFRQFKMPNK